MGAPKERPCLEQGLNRPEEMWVCLLEEKIARGCEGEKIHTERKRDGESKRQRSDAH